MLFVVLWGSLFGVDPLAACWSKLSRLSVSIFVLSCSLSFIDRFTLFLITCLWVSQFVFELCKRAVGFRTVTDVMENGQRLCRNLIVCLCILRRFHWLQRNLVDPGFCFRQ